MRFRTVVVFATALTSLTAIHLTAQTTSELSGRVIYEGRGMAGVTVTVASSSLQGRRTTITNAQGDYILKHLPAGDYQVRFELETFATLEYELKITTAQPKFLDALMYPEAMQEEIVVAGQYEAVSTGAQGSGTVEQGFLEQLALPRTLEAAVLLSAGTAAYGGSNRISISGAPTDSSLYLMNGVVLNHNTGGFPLEMYIEDAILETTTMTNSMSAEYGRFSGGLVTMITKSGGNEFSGSLRASLSNDSWNGATPLSANQVDEINTIWEATFGGYLWRDRLWFFLAGRDQSLSESDQVVTPGQPEAAIPFTSGEDETRLEAKITGSFNPNHRITLSYIDTVNTSTNRYLFTPADFASIDPKQTRPIVGWSLSYTGVLSDNFFVEGLYSERDLRFQDVGGDDTRLGATPVWDMLTGVGFNAPPFWAEKVSTLSNANVYAKGSWFFSAAGTHDLVFGLDIFDDKVEQNYYQSATGYIWAAVSPQNYNEAGNPYTHIDTFGGFIVWAEVLEESRGNSFKTISAYANDSWRISDRWTVNLGLRYDRNDGTNTDGAKVVDDSRVSPRLSASWDVRGNGSIILTGGASQYVEEIGQTGDVGTRAGWSSWISYIYGGPQIHAGTPDYPTNFDAISAMFDWFFDVYGGPTNLSLAAFIQVPGLSPKIVESLSSPYANELTAGASFRLGARGVVRLDYVHRKFGDAYDTEIVPYRWVESEEFGIVIDQAVIVNDNDHLERRYDALLARFDYRIGSQWSFGANYTGSQLRGNYGGAGIRGGGSTPLAYQEYNDPSWSRPEITNRRHTLRAWAIWNALSTNHHNLSVSLLQNLWTGNYYSAVGYIDTTPYVGAPAELGYAGSPGTVTYFFETGAYRTDDITRTDLALNYSFFINLGGSQLELFIQPEVINLFNESAAVNVDTLILTAAILGSGLEPFDPWTTDPVEGVHWQKGPQFGQPMTEHDYQQPRTFRFSVGLRF
jgi:hypothetical protein